MSKKILWFVAGAISAVHMAHAHANGLTIRSLDAYREGDFLEVCDGVCGDAPEAYRKRFKEVELGDMSQHAGSSADTNGDGKVSIAEIRNALTAKGIEFDPKAKKAELQALLEQAEQSEAIKVQLAEKGIEPPADATLETLQQLLEGAE